MAKYVVLRNALVHAAGVSTADLSQTWPERFPAERISIELDSFDVVAAHKAA